MSQQVDKLKKKAAEFEAKRQTDKAIATYLEMFRIWDSGDDDDVEVPLYNRVGDMLIRAGNIGDAMTVWEKAVDYYGDKRLPRQRHRAVQQDPAPFSRAARRCTTSSAR